MANPRPAVDLHPAVAPFRSPSDPSRLTVVRHRAGGEAQMHDRVQATGLVRSTVSAHTRRLHACWPVSGRAEGCRTFYAQFRPELLDLLVSAESWLGAAGAQVSLCPDSATPTGAGADDEQDER